jgi:hypothetical protein
MRDPTSKEPGPGTLGPRGVAEEYELHSRRSTALNEVLMQLQAAPRRTPLPQEWHEALRVNLFSMWLHQVLAFEHALNSLWRYEKQVARRQGKLLSDFGGARKANARQLWPDRSSAIKIYHKLAELGEFLTVGSHPQFCHEVTVAPRHFIWRDAWAHIGGRLQERYPETYDYYRQRGAVEQRDGSAWPLDPAWQEARLSFQQLVQLLTRPHGGSKATR